MMGYVNAALQSGLLLFILAVYFLPGFLFSYGAAKLSYDKYGSVFWAIIDFYFAIFYYPYYALFLNTPTHLAVAGRR